MRVSATDIDDGNNSVVRYSLSPKKFDDVMYFRIDRESGIIFLSKVIDVSRRDIKTRDIKKVVLSRFIMVSRCKAHNTFSAARIGNFLFTCKFSIYIYNFLLHIVGIVMH